MADRRELSDRACEYRDPVRIQDFASWEAFEKLDPAAQDVVWAQLRGEIDLKVEGIARYESGLLDFPPEPKPARKRAWTPRPIDKGAALDDIETPDYVFALTGEDVQPGRSASCPLPDHDDRSPSFVAYGGGSFNCFGCNRGGTIFQFAAYLWGYPMPLRGDTFREIRARLLDTLRMT